ncbi:hypothetical protein [Enterobacter phage vB_ExiM_F5M1E]|nr:hypothetical protein [Enterobacter phage vB_ExiM_F1M1E]UNA03006.1 hypothetical protein [Enterobacter phage vB_ExiM_F2M1E]UNA03327.1 hypothetical protein [Enterobacter phage vB_ExiM_F4M1E]UNA03648.1 hypothetical protein [Enterobacter phage vB_ExiM_F5M1E]UNA03968.1 hypothetical protein [Pantoea phage vB_PdiM_F5M2A]
MLIWSKCRMELKHRSEKTKFPARSNRSVKKSSIRSYHA